MAQLRYLISISKERRIACYALLAQSLVSTVMWAQDEMTQLQQDQEEQRVNEAQQALKEESQPVLEPNVDEGISMDEAAPAGRVYVRSVSLIGNTIFEASELLGEAQAPNAELSLADLQGLAQSVENYYRERGYVLTKVVIPRQNVPEQDGELRMQVLEGTLGAVEVSGNERFETERVHGYLKGLPAGEPLVVRSLAEQLHLMNELSGVSFKAALKPGEALGSTDLQVEVTEAKRVTADFEVNNFGTENTGEYRFVSAIGLPNTFGRGDSLSFDLLASLDFQETLYGQVSYSTPIGFSGLMASAYVAAGEFEVGEEFAALGVEGESQSWGLGLSYPIFMNGASSLVVDSWLISRDSDQFLLGTKTSEDKIRKLQLGISYDRKAASGRFLGSVKLDQGLGESLGGMDDDATLSSRSFAQADNSFTKLSLSLAQIQRLSHRAFLIARFSGQYSFDTLVASEQWSIGGANSVRGHPQASYLGDHGYTINLEGRYSILSDSDDYQAVAFFDHGQIFIDEPVIGQDSSELINGAGLGLRALLFGNVSLRTDVAVPVGDKTDDDVYFYIQGRISF